MQSKNVARKIWATSEIFEKLSKANNLSLGENSRTLALKYLPRNESFFVRRYTYLEKQVSLNLLPVNLSVF
jgi:hypothetical protein